MIYPYACKLCNHQFEVIKSVRDIDNPEACAECGSEDTERRIAMDQSFSKIAAADWDRARYSPALGKVVKNDAEERKIAKSKGMIEVGNEDIGKIEKEFARDREKKAQYKSISELTSLGEIRG